MKFISYVFKDQFFAACCRNTALTIYIVSFDKKEMKTYLLLFNEECTDNSIVHAISAP